MTTSTTVNKYMEKRKPLARKLVNVSCFSLKTTCTNCMQIFIVKIFDWWNEFNITTKLHSLQVLSTKVYLLDSEP